MRSDSLTRPRGGRPYIYTAIARTRHHPRPNFPTLTCTRSFTVLLTIPQLANPRYDWLVDTADLLRKLLRVKVEDGNDLQMAATTVEEVHRFHTRLVEHAAETGEDQYSLYVRLVTL